MIEKAMPCFTEDYKESLYLLENNEHIGISQPMIWLIYLSHDLQFRSSVIYASDSELLHSQNIL